MSTRAPIQLRPPAPALLESPPAAYGQDHLPHSSSADRKAGSIANNMASIFASASTQDGDTAKVPVLQLSRRPSLEEASPHLLPLSSPDTPSSPHILSSNLGSLSEGQAGASLQNFRHCHELLWHANEDNKVLQGRLQSSIDRNTSFANQVWVLAQKCRQASVTVAQLPWQQHQQQQRQHDCLSLAGQCAAGEHAPRVRLCEE